MSPDFTTTACRSAHLLARTLESFHAHLRGVDFKRCRLALNVDPVPDVRHPQAVVARMLDVARTYFGDVFISAPSSPSFPAAVRTVWAATAADRVFHLEYDWELRRDIDVYRLDDALREFDSCNLPCYGFTHHSPALLPGLWRGDTVRAIAAELNDLQDPELQTRAWFARNNRRAYHLPGPKAVFDIGRDWREVVGCEKNTGGNNYFTCWVRRRARPRLSLLVLTTDRRKAYLDRLMAALEPQLVDRPVQLLTVGGPGTIGYKRNLALKNAGGAYVAFIDDDDMVSADYVESILEALGDGCEFTHLPLSLEYYVDGQRRGDADHSSRHSRWATWPGGRNGAVYLRTPNHLNVIRADLARQVGFPEINSGEDRQFSDRIKPLLTCEGPRPRGRYIYLFRTRKEPPWPSESE